uniref:DH domain-containing protein n=2 Tax=Panagrolaimus sp. JU765 TaxID=591449 RepID=A0AC34PWD4_9BILA
MALPEFIVVQLHPESSGVQEGPHLVQTVPGRKLSDCLEPYLTLNGLCPDHVEYFLEKSSTPIPESSDSRFLAGHKIFVKLKREMLTRGRSAAVAPTLIDTMVDQMPFNPDRKVSAYQYRNYDPDLKPDKRKSSMDTISRKASFGTRKLCKPRSLSTCPVNNLFAEENAGSLSATSTPTHSYPSIPGGSNPYLGELVAAYPPRRSSASVDSNPGDGAGSSTDGSSIIFCEETGTISARGRTPRRGIFSKENKLTIVADRILSQIQNHRGNELSILETEEHWTLIVKKYQQISESAQKQQAALWEMVETEKRYIQSLQSMDDLTFVFRELQRQGFMTDLDSKRVFSNYGDLLKANLLFWKRGILPMISAARESANLLNPTKMLPGFEDIVNWSRCYIEFNISHTDTLNYVKTKQKDNERFGEFVQWCESLNMMNRQTLIDNLSIPMQRLTRYPLMLKNVIKASVDSEERMLLQKMIENAEQATGLLNSEMNNNDLRVQLIEIIKTLESYDAVDTEEYDKVFGGHPPGGVQYTSSGVHNYLNLLHPMRCATGPKHRRIFTKGDLKMREGRQGPKVEVHAILFTDLLLICKPTSRRNDRYRIIKPPIHSMNLRCCLFMDTPGFYLAVMNEFGSPAFFFMMFTSNFEDARRWIEMIDMAKAEFCNLAAIEGAVPVFDKDRHLLRRSQRSQTPTSQILADAKAAIAHRKSHSMDSQVVAAASRPNSSHLRKSDAIASAEQLDRRHVTDCTPGSSGSKISLASSFADESSPSQQESSPVRTASAVSVNRQPEQDPNPPTNSPVVDGNPDAADDINPCSPIDFGISADSLSSQNLRQLALNNGRRFEKRYHTVGEIDSQRPPNGNGPTTILKRFSWNVSSAMSGSSRKISSKLHELNGRRYSQSTVGSSDSFGSSTSGISSASASSQDNNTIIAGSMTDTPTLMNLAAEVEPTHHVSTVMIGGELSPRKSENGANHALNIKLEQVTVTDPIPPVPEIPPPDSGSDEPTSATLQKTSSELLKFILDDNVETSDI